MSDTEHSLATLSTELGRLTARLAQVEQKLAAKEREREKPGPHYERLHDFVEDFIADIVERRVSNTIRWCAEWYRHPEANIRFQALWKAYEHLRADDAGEGLSLWFTQHLDPHLEAMMNADGPFAGCSPQRHISTRQLVMGSSADEVWGSRRPLPTDLTADDLILQPSPS